MIGRHNRWVLVGLAALLCASGCDSTPRNPAVSNKGDEAKGAAQPLAQPVDAAEPAPVGTFSAPALPGIDAPDASLTASLRDAYDARGASYKARTRHLDAEGKATFTNRLIRQTSPYLLQHAHNPVNWYPWSPEAFAHAQELGRPILLSVGYSTCHWCHVMEEESFEDEEIAAFINSNFIAIKVDREERPDVDDVYMKAVNLLTGRGGWPMTVVMTPAQQPFFGGTYFPARDGDRGAHKGFLTILKDLSRQHRDDPEGVVARAKSLSEKMAKMSAAARPGDVPGPQVIRRAVLGLSQRFDARNGGFGRQPKFPTPVNLELLMHYWRRTEDPGALEMVTRTLDKIAAGGIHDQVGGGFHRYAVDARWLVPHFEKMLYDNAQLAMIYLSAFQATARQGYRRVVEKTLDYVLREMTHSGGGFYSATDADSANEHGEREEGWFFTWTPDELAQVLSADELALVTAHHGVTPAGNFEGRNILHVARPLAELTGELGAPVESLRARLSAAHQKLYAARGARPAPGLDDKILVSWNGLMISAMARAGLALEQPRYTDAAARAASFILEEMRGEDGRLRRSYKDGATTEQAFLDDYAFLIQGVLDLFEATGDVAWLEHALALQEQLDKLYVDARGGAYYMTASDAEALLVRQTPSYDGAQPSGNSIAAMNAMRLHELTTQERFRERAERVFAGLSAGVKARPSSASMTLCALDYYLDRPREIIIAAPSASADVSALVREVRQRRYLGNHVLVLTVDGEVNDAQARVAPFVKGKKSLKGTPRAFVCEKGRCELPVSDAAGLAAQLDGFASLFPDGGVPRLVVPE